jgi:hypothetical protein
LIFGSSIILFGAGTDSTGGEDNDPVNPSFSDNPTPSPAGKLTELGVTGPQLDCLLEVVEYEK